MKRTISILLCLAMLLMSVSALADEYGPTEFLLRSAGRRLKLRIENVNGSDFDLSGGAELLFDEQRRVL